MDSKERRPPTMSMSKNRATIIAPPSFPKDGVHLPPSGEATGPQQCGGEDLAPSARVPTPGNKGSLLIGPSLPCRCYRDSRSSQCGDGSSSQQLASEGLTDRHTVPNGGRVRSRGSVKLGSRVADSGDGYALTELPWPPLSSRDHLPCRLALPPLLPELPRRRGPLGGARHHRVPRDSPAVVPEVRH